MELPFPIMNRQNFQRTQVNTFLFFMNWYYLKFYLEKLIFTYRENGVFADFYNDYIL